MFYKQYGDTDMKVSAIGMGCMRYNMEDIDNNRLEKCAEVALYAHEKGINYFDTAPGYCKDKSEIITGIALSQLKRDSYYVSSKIGLGKTEVPTESDLRRKLETSLERLHVDALDFYHIWCVVSPEDFKRKADILYPFFQQAKSEGLIKNIVFSSHMEGSDIEDVIAKDMFKGMLIGYNALNYSFRQSGIKAAHDKGMGVVVMNPLGGGLIPQNPEYFQYLTEGTDLTVAQAGLRFVASHKEITITLSGCSEKAHVDDACKAVENLVEKPAQEICEQYKAKGLALNTLCTGCGYCNSCPVGIPIPKLMDAYNLKILGQGGNVVGRCQNHWHIDINDAKKCVGCRKCEGLCTQHLPIVERLGEISKLI